MSLIVYRFSNGYYKEGFVSITVETISADINALVSCSKHAVAAGRPEEPELVGQHLFIGGIGCFMVKVFVACKEEDNILHECTAISLGQQLKPFMRSSLSSQQSKMCLGYAARLEQAVHPHSH